MKSILLALLCFWTIQMNSQTLKPFQDQETNLWGLKDSESSKIVVQPKYENIRAKEQGFIVNENEQTGLLNPQGKLVIPPKYNGGLIFLENGHIRVLSDMKNGVLDENYKEVIPIEYDDLRIIHPNQYRVTKDKKMGHLDMEGNVVIPIEFRHIEYFERGFAIASKEIDDRVYFGVINLEGKEVLPFKYPNIAKAYKYFYKITEPQRRYGYQRNKDNETPINPESIGKFFNQKGEEVDFSQYKLVNGYDQDLLIQAYIEGPNGTKEERIYGFLDLDGKPVTEFKYNSASKFHNGHCIVEIKTGDNNWVSGLIDSLGNEVLMGQFNHIGTVNDNRIIAYKGEIERNVGRKYLTMGKYGLVDLKGNTIVPFQYDFLVRLGGDNLYKAYKGKLDLTGQPASAEYAIINQNGEKTSSYLFGTIGYFRNGLATVYTNPELDKQGNPIEGSEKFGYINTKGEVVVTPQFEEAQDVDHRGFAVVGKLVHEKMKYGLIDAKGNQVIPPLYDKINTNWDHNIFKRVFIGTLDHNRNPKEGKYGVYNKLTGKYSKVKYDRIDGHIVFARLKDKHGNIMKDQYFVLDLNGVELNKTPFDYVEPLGSKLFKVFIVTTADNGEKIGKYGIMNFNGEMIVPAKFDDIQNHTETHFLTQNYGDIEDRTNVYNYGLFTIDGKEVVPPTYDKIFAFKEGLAQVIHIKKEGDEFNVWVGYIDENGREVVPTKYNGISAFTGDIARVFKGDLETQEGKYGYINRQAKEIIDLEYESLGMPSQGLILAEKDGKFGYLNLKGKVVIPFKYSQAEDFIGGKAKVTLKSNEVYINKKGKVIKEE